MRKSEEVEVTLIQLVTALFVAVSELYSSATTWYAVARRTGIDYSVFQASAFMMLEDKQVVVDSRHRINPICHIVRVNQGSQLDAAGHLETLLGPGRIRVGQVYDILELAREVKQRLDTSSNVK
jgi:hypothetical protein